VLAAQHRPAASASELRAYGPRLAPAGRIRPRRPGRPGGAFPRRYPPHTRAPPPLRRLRRRRRRPTPLRGRNLHGQRHRARRASPCRRRGRRLERPRFQQLGFSRSFCLLQMRRQHSVSRHNPLQRQGLPIRRPLPLHPARESTRFAQADDSIASHPASGGWGIPPALGRGSMSAQGGRSGRRGVPAKVEAAAAAASWGERVAAARQAPSDPFAQAGPSGPLPVRRGGLAESACAPTRVGAASKRRRKGPAVAASPPSPREFATVPQWGPSATLPNLTFGKKVDSK
jgi:hypothetical protein